MRVRTKRLKTTNNQFQSLNKLNHIQPQQIQHKQQISLPLKIVRYRSQSHAQTNKDRQFKRNKDIQISNKDIRINKDNKDNKDIDSNKDHVFSHTANLLQNKTFQHINNLSTIHNKCSCGRHFSKFNVIKPNLSKNTMYKKHYRKQMRIHNKMHITKQYERFNIGPNIHTNTTYHNGYKGKDGDPIQKSLPKDWLNIDGPLQQLTSYNIQYPGHHGQNQYIKPTDKHSIQYHPLRCKTTYSCQYKKPQYKKDDYKYISDHLKTGNNWFGKTTYQAMFQQPDIDYYAKKVKITQKLQENPNYAKQYQTEYKTEFKMKGNAVCPAKIYLETQGKNKFRQSKKYMTENSDYKSFQPDFKAISNSKHYYI